MHVLLFTRGLRHSASRCLPAKAVERDSSARVEIHSLSLEEEALRQRWVAVSTCTHHPACVDDAMPRHSGAASKRMQRISNQPRLAWKPGQHGDLTIGGNAAARNLPHGRIDALVGRVLSANLPWVHLTAEPAWGT